jgi:hypothetical protein
MGQIKFPHNRNGFLAHLSTFKPPLVWNSKPENPEAMILSSGLLPMRDNSMDHILGSIGSKSNSNEGNIGSQICEDFHLVESAEFSVRHLK